MSLFLESSLVGWKRGVGGEEEGWSAGEAVCGGSVSLLVGRMPLQV